MLLRSVLNYYFLIIPIVIFVMASAYRLARFNVSSPKGYFEGMPTTTNGILVAGLFLLNLANYIPCVLIISSLLMVSKIKLSKRKLFYFACIFDSIFLIINIYYLMSGVIIA